jgi:hypothetical protein
MAQFIGPPFGDGSAGKFLMGSNNNTDLYVDRATITGTAGTTSLSKGVTNPAGYQFSTGRMVIIHQSRGTGAGQWEFNRIANDNGYSQNAGTITMNIPLSYNYYAGAQMYAMLEYSEFTVSAGVTLSAVQWDGSYGGIIPILCNGTTRIDGLIDAGGKGYAGGRYGDGGGTANQGEGTAGAGTDNNQSPNGNGGGGGHDHATGGAAGCGGGGGGNASSGTNGSAGQGCPGGGTDYGQGGNSSGASDLSTMTFGGGGGGGGRGDYDNANGHWGGAGGGIIVIVSKIITISGGVYSNGVAGDNAYFSGAAGGGGAGGSVLLRGLQVNMGTNITTALQASGGAQGQGGHWGGPGGAGSAGRIRVESGSLNGSTNGPSPTFNSTIVPWAGKIGIVG